MKKVLFVSISIAWILSTNCGRRESESKMETQNPPAALPEANSRSTSSRAISSNIQTTLAAAQEMMSGSTKSGASASSNRVGPATSNALTSQKRVSKAVEHFWFDYQGQPDPGRRVWVQVDDDRWAELYPNGNVSRYRIGDRIIVRGIVGTSARKVAGDPTQTLTPNDGSFEVFIPDRDSPRLILAFRQVQKGQWTEWQPLALIHPIH